MRFINEGQAIMNMLTCSRCGTQNVVGSKFCSQCGAPINPYVTRIPGPVDVASICPTCKKSDKAKSIYTIIQAQQSTKLANEIVTARGRKPRSGRLERLIHGSAKIAKQLEAYELVESKWDISYYCERCSLFFFIYKGQKRSGKNFHAILRENFKSKL